MSHDHPEPAPAVGSGLVVVDKPAGLTSHDVVARVRRLARTRKVGHAGTLDPMATGVLLVGVNRATRLLGHLALTSKSYDAVVRLGATTTTDDAEGEVVARAPVAGLTESAVRTAVAGFVGELQQRPSAVSAVKVDGRRAYDRVRAGEQVVLAARPVTVHSFEVRSVEPAEDGAVLDVAVSVRCSSGTYVRALARDLGEALGVGGHLTALRRTEVGGVTLAEATPLEDLLRSGEVPLLSLEQVAERFFPVVRVDADGARAVSYGRRLDLTLRPGGPSAVLGPDGAFLALYEAADPRVGGEPRADDAFTAHPVAVFV